MIPRHQMPPPYPVHVRPTVESRAPGLNGDEREAVAHAVIRMVRWRRGILSGPAADSAISAVAQSPARYRRLADLTWEIAAEIEPEATEYGPGRISYPDCRPQWTLPEMIAGLRRLANALGRTPMTREVDACPWTPSYQTYADRMGGGRWRDAVRACGLVPYAQGEKPRRAS